jgi:hypothetical protein
MFIITSGPTVKNANVHTSKTYSTSISGDIRRGIILATGYRQFQNHFGGVFREGDAPAEPP